MKRIGLILGAVVAAVSMAAGASSVSAYPPGTEATVTVSDSTLAPGASFTATFTGCQLGETVNFTLDGTTVQAACNGAAGARRLPSATGAATATATLTAPTAPGTYELVAVGLTSGADASTTIVVAAAAGGGQIPETGSDSSIPAAQIAGGLVVVGAGLAGVAGIRRRKATAAA